MFTRIFSACLMGLDAQIVEVETDVFWGLPGMSIVGLPGTSVQEARERIRSALKHSGYDYPAQRITVNMAPGNVRKQGTSFDLAIALGVLSASEQITTDFLPELLILGELALDGRLRPIQGILSILQKARSKGFKRVILPFENASEAQLIQDLHIQSAFNLNEALQALKDAHWTNKESPPSATSPPCEDWPDFSEICGQQTAKRGLEICAAGGHNLLMTGPPGSGKSMLAKSLAGILPRLSYNESLETSSIFSAVGKFQAQFGLMTYRPFRMPHHTITKASLIGGGRPPRPGEISLAHHGVLFLDELLEFKRDVLESLRQPLEEGSIQLSRGQYQCTLPARHILVATLNPCPCGQYGNPRVFCRCSELQRERYWKKLSGPLLDRIDIYLTVPRLASHELQYDSQTERSETVSQRVEKARQIQHQRFKNSGVYCNGQMPTDAIRSFCALDNAEQELLTQAAERLKLSGRGYMRSLKLARTIADLAQSESIKVPHLAEALQYREQSCLA